MQYIVGHMDNQSQVVIYQTENGDTKLEVRLEHETVWLSQKQLAELFQTSIPNINIHLKNIFEEKELVELSTIKDFLIVQNEGGREVKRNQKFYNLDVIISVGYRIKSHVATRFRQWATLRIREYIVKGFVLDDERLKNPDLPFDYFDELLRRIQDIRTSERRFYQKNLHPTLKNILQRRHYLCKLEGKASILYFHAAGALAAQYGNGHFAHG